MLSVENVSSGYDGIQVVSGVSIRVNEGEIVSVIGPNGSGKTTLLLTVSGLLPCRNGRKVFCGQDITDLPAHQLVLLGMVQVLSRNGIFPRLTVADNLALGCYGKYRHLGKKGREGLLRLVLDLFPVLGERIGQPARLLSGGEQQMLSIGRALMAQPKLLMLDEPSFGLSPLVLAETSRTLQRLNREEGLALLLVEQYMPLALGLAQRVYVLDEGRVVVEGNPEALSQDEKIRDVYLGAAGGEE